MSIFVRFGNVYSLMVDVEKRWQFEKQILLEFAETSGIGEKRVLDLACGTGFHALKLAGEGCKVTAIDRAESMLEVARSEAGSELNINWEQGDVLKPLSGSYDLVLLLGNTLSLFADKQAVFHNIAEVICKKGIFLLQVIDYEYLRQNGIKQTLRSGLVAGSETVINKLLIPQPQGAQLAFTVIQKCDSGWQCEAELTSLTETTEAELRQLADENNFKILNIYSALNKAQAQPGQGSDRVYVLQRS